MVYPPSRIPQGRTLMAFIDALAGLVALGLMVYLVVALLKPEVFE